MFKEYSKLERLWFKVYYTPKRIYEWVRYDFPAGLKNLYLWRKVIWQDRNWDHSYIYKILRHKLALTEECIRTNDRHMDAQIEAQKIRICLDMLDRIIKDEYLEACSVEHKKKWGEADYNFVPVESGCSRMNVTYSNANTKEENELARKEFGKAAIDSLLLKEKEIRTLFKLIGNNIEGWWD
jgi:hypothetical protein